MEPFPSVAPFKVKDLSQAPINTNQGRQSLRAQLHKDFWHFEVRVVFRKLQEFLPCSVLSRSLQLGLIAFIIDMPSSASV